jgi:thiol-disulfide isomerase/thioredoxin
MSNLLSENRFLLAVLVGGVLFLTAAVCLVGVLLLWTPAAEVASVAANTPQAAVPPPTSPVESGATKDETQDMVEPTLTATPTSTPHPSPTPTATPTPAEAAGARLTLPTAAPTHTNTPIPPPPTPILPPVEGLRVGNIAPDFTLGSNRASRVSLRDLRGKIVILNFWASWCPPCRYEVPALQAIHNEYGPQGVVVLAVNEGEKLPNVERFAYDNGISFAVWLDEDGWAGNIYRVHSIPTTYFIDEEGIIRAIQIGSMSREQIVTHLEKLL